jgi:hypothetical protein
MRACCAVCIAAYFYCSLPMNFFFTTVFNVFTTYLHFFTTHPSFFTCCLVYTAVLLLVYTGAA